MSETTAIFPKLSPLEGHLWARSGKNVGRRYSIGKSEQTLGRSPSCDVEVEDDRVSLQHAKVVLIEGRHHIYDLASTNGTFVNDQRVDEAELRDGDIIQIGETIFEYLCNEERALTITLRGSADSVVPSALREGAKQMLQRERTTDGPEGEVPASQPQRSMPHINLKSIPIGHSSQPQPSPPGGVPHIAGLHGQNLHAQNPGMPGMGMPGMGMPGAQVPGMHPMAQLPMPMHQVPGMHPGMMPSNMPVPYIGPDGLQHMAPPPMYPPPSVTIPAGDEEGPQLSLADVLAKARKIMAEVLPYWPSVTALFVVGLLLGIASLKLMPPTRRATFQMSIHPNQAENPVATNFQRTALQFFRSAEQNFVSPPLIRKTLLLLGYEEITDKDVARVQAGLLFSKMGGGVPGHPMNSQSNTYQGMYFHPSPNEALRFLDKHLRVYLDSEVEKVLRVIQVEVDFLAKQVAEAQEELHRSEWELTEFKRKNIDATPDTARQIYAQAMTLAMRQRELEQEAARHSAALAHDRRKVTFQSPFEDTNIIEDRPYRQQLVTKRQELAKAESEGKGPLHPDVLKLTGEIRELEALEAEAAASNPTTKTTVVNPTYREAINTEAATEKSRDVSALYASQLKKDLDEIREKIADLPEREAAYASLLAKFEGAKETYNKLIAQEKAAKMQLQLERAASVARYDIIVPPQIELDKPLKNLAIRGAGGAMAFAFLGVARVGFIMLRRFLKSVEEKAAMAANTEEKGLVPAGPGGLAPTDQDRQ